MNRKQDRSRWTGILGHDAEITGHVGPKYALYARGMTVREIQAFLAEQYGTEVSPDFISSVTDAVTLPLFRGVLNPRFTRPFYAVPRTSVVHTAWD